jgi:hypothetical protein
MVLALRGEEHPLAHQIGEPSNILVALAHAHLIHADATHAAEVRRGVGRVDLPEEHPPQPRALPPTTAATLLMGISRMGSSAKASNSLVKWVLSPSHGGRTRNM